MSLARGIRASASALPIQFLLIALSSFVPGVRAQDDQTNQAFTGYGWVTGEGLPACFVNWEVVKDDGGTGDACIEHGYLFFLNMAIFYYILQTLIRLFMMATQ